MPKLFSKPRHDIVNKYVVHLKQELWQVPESLETRDTKFK